MSKPNQPGCPTGCNKSTGACFPGDQPMDLPCYCGTQCPACGGVYLTGNGTITDVNGTHQLTNYQSPIIWQTQQALQCTWCGDPGLSNTLEQVVEASVPYQWTFKCQGNQIYWGLATWPPLVPVGCNGVYPPAGSPAYTACTGWGGSCGASLTAASIGPGTIGLSTPTACNPQVTGTVNPVAGMYNFAYPWQPAVPSGNYSLEVFSPEHRVCCSPCGIPAKNLTVSLPGSLPGTGTGTLVYNSTNITWLSGWFQVSYAYVQVQLVCYQGQSYIVLSGSAKPDGGGGYVFCSTVGGNAPLVSYTCSPFHLDFTCVSSATHVYIDE